jgi:hypothetical protein
MLPVRASHALFAALPGHDESPWPSRLRDVPAPSRPARSSSLYREVGALFTFCLQRR